MPARSAPSSSRPWSWPSTGNALRGRRRGSSARTSRWVLFLAADDSSFVTGSTVAVDGGMSSQGMPSSPVRRVM
ncbi:SDR family oxidoreductase [Nonomuraea sp. PA05]|uniref:SDR family oxidoreductase n=1 Tax=Nonomuraea sp. PA05 TaxID=2604466 RepID=UPI0011D34E62|nr:SDR family oxidoreductase [Nonomuraea sp. PA05]